MGGGGEIEERFLCKLFFPWSAFGKKPHFFPFSHTFRYNSLACKICFRLVRYIVHFLKVSSTIPPPSPSTPTPQALKRSVLNSEIVSQTNPLHLQQYTLLIDQSVIRDN